MKRSRTCAPRDIISWNANGLIPQLKSNWKILENFLTTHPWDVFFVQEARLPACAPPGCKKGDGQKRERDRMRTSTTKKVEKEEYDLVQHTLVRLARTMGAEVLWSLADYKYAGSACLVKEAFLPTNVEYSIPQLANVDGHFDQLSPSHHPEGRIIRLHYDSFQILQTYSPNNGKDAASFKRRRLWDEALLEFCKTEEALIWVGDLNVAHKDCDVSHPSWFAEQFSELHIPLESRGQPGFTPVERQRFSKILEQGNMTDAYRRLHPRDAPPPVESNEYSWRGAAPINFAFSKYYGKGMRIDHALVKESFMSQVESVELLGKGKDRDGFLGSDHSPLHIKLKSTSSRDDPPAGVGITDPRESFVAASDVVAPLASAEGCVAPDGSADSCANAIGRVTPVEGGAAVAHLACAEEGAASAAVSATVKTKGDDPVKKTIPFPFMKILKKPLDH
eukprot:GEMP01040927.1.p1 GENE.GEMP01040927.1~~GEMP01040927.1.p1  ORF type:complete len:449 (+),score=97.46 GEMP01040927.1:63-1409(+)